MNDFASIVGMLVDPGLDPDEIDNLRRALQKEANTSLQWLHQAAEKMTSTGDWSAKVRIAIVALHLGDASLAIEMLLNRRDPVQRTVFIDEFNRWTGNVERLAEIAGTVEDPDFQSGICLALGGLERPSKNVKQAWNKNLQAWYIRKNEAGTGGPHSASSWLMNHWNLEAPEAGTSKTEPNAEWWHTPQGVRLVKINSGGSVAKLKLQSTKVSHPYWIGDSEITREQYLEFLADGKFQSELPFQNPFIDIKNGVEYVQINPSSSKTISSPANPAIHVSWFSAVAFCNWLSFKNGLDPCYKITKVAKVKGWGKKKRQNKFIVIWNQSANGFRLPTAQEWEHANRAKTITPFFFGENEKMLENYCWMTNNSDGQSQTVRTKLCNPWGIFDSHGNVWEWCWDGDSDQKNRMVRGGGWRDESSSFKQSGQAESKKATSRNDQIGFRVAQGPVTTDPNATITSSSQPATDPQK